jgi:hypothetical protein
LEEIFQKKYIFKDISTPKLYYMAKKLLVLILIVFINRSLKAQEHFLIYNSDSEKSLLTSVQSPVDDIKLALVADLNDNDANTLLAKLNSDIKQLGWEATADQKTDKRLKTLFQKVHSTFLKKYDENAAFSKLFNTGEYQCVGASILYAYILEQCKIPYQIKETPTHVYVVAYPESYNILFETTDPTKGYFVPDDKSKANYIKQLVKSKYLDEVYVSKVGIDQAFNEFFYSKTSITLKEAVGLLYYNKAIEKMDADKASEAYSNISKAQILYPAKKNEFLKSQIMDQMIQNFKFNELKDWEGLTYSVNSKGATEDSKKYVEYQFNELIQSKLWKEGQKDKVVEVYNYLRTNLKDSTLESNIEENYLFESARYEYNSNRYPEALQYLDKAIIKSPNSLMVKSMMVDLIAVKMMDQQTGSARSIAWLDHNVARYPFLAANTVIRSAYLYNYTFLSYTAFSKEDAISGGKYMKLMMYELDTYKDHAVKNEIQIGNAFGRASEYYYRKQGKQKAMEILNTGLKYVPDNELLLRKIKVFRSN